MAARRIAAVKTRGQCASHVIESLLTGRRPTPSLPKDQIGDICSDAPDFFTRIQQCSQSAAAEGGKSEPVPAHEWEIRPIEPIERKHKSSMVSDHSAAKYFH